MAMNILGRKHKREMSAVVAAATALCSLSAQAFQLDTQNPDLSVRWDNTVRLNAGWRVEARDQRIGNNPAFDESDYKFDRGDMVTKRIDLLTELDMAWKRNSGARISATAWYDDAYRDTSVRGNPIYAALGTSYFDQQYSATAKRYHRGMSGEVLDAFLWSNFDVGATPVSVKAGRFSTYWGNSTFFAGGISRGQQPIDGRKAVSSPGLEVKETFLPLAQFNTAVQVTPQLAVTAQYYFDWANTRGADGGTFLAGSDFVIDGPQRTALGSANFDRVGSLEPEKKRGNWGINARYSPAALDGGTVGAYYRKYDEKTPFFFTVPNGGVPTQYRAVYSRDAELYGLSYEGSVGPVSLGAELGYHKNVGLTSQSFRAVTEAARGDTWHAVVNGVYGLPPTALWQTGVLVGELAYTRLDKVTANAGTMSPMVGQAACVNSATGAAGTAKDGCVTKDAWGVAFKFTPQYAQIFPGVDLDVPLTVNYGIKGNSASALGVAGEGVVTYSIGLATKIYVVHNLELTYADSHAPMRVRTVAFGDLASGGNGSFSQNDRGRITLMYKTAF